MLTNSQLICCLFTKPTGKEQYVKKYGNEICLFDATYKTSCFALPLFFCASKVMSITVLLGHLSYSERPRKRLLKHLMCYVSGTHNGCQDFS